jgi:hypothetical protein
MEVRLSALRAGRSLSPRSFLVLISVRGRVDPRTIVRLEGLGQWKNPVTRDLPACSIVLQPTTLLRAPTYFAKSRQIRDKHHYGNAYKIHYNSYEWQWFKNYDVDVTDDDRQAETRLLVNLYRHFNDKCTR